MYVTKNQLICLSKEQEDTFSNICKILTEINITAVVIKYSALYTYIYRVIKYSLSRTDPLKHLDESFVNQVGIDNFGKVSWNMISNIKTFEIRREMIKPFIFKNDNLNISGYDIFKKVLKLFITEPKIFTNIIYEKINLNLDVNNIESKFNFMKKFDALFETDYSQKRFPAFLEIYLKHLNKKASSTITKNVITDIKKPIVSTRSTSPIRITKRTTSVGTQTDEVDGDITICVNTDGDESDVYGIVSTDVIEPEVSGITSPEVSGITSPEVSGITSPEVSGIVEPEVSSYDTCNHDISDSGINDPVSRMVDALNDNLETVNI
jgi:hypothetical protein